MECKTPFLLLEPMSCGWLRLTVCSGKHRGICGLYTPAWMHQPDTRNQSPTCTDFSWNKLPVEK